MTTPSNASFLALLKRGADGEVVGRSSPPPLSSSTSPAALTRPPSSNDLLTLRRSRRRLSHHRPRRPSSSSAASASSASLLSQSQPQVAFNAPKPTYPASRPQSEAQTRPESHSHPESHPGSHSHPESRRAPHPQSQQLASVRRNRPDSPDRDGSTSTLVLDDSASLDSAISASPLPSPGLATDGESSRFASSLLQAHDYAAIRAWGSSAARSRPLTPPPRSSSSTTPNGSLLDGSTLSRTPPSRSFDGASDGASDDAGAASANGAGSDGSDSFATCSTSCESGSDDGDVFVDAVARPVQTPPVSPISPGSGDDAGERKRQKRAALRAARDADAASAAAARARRPRSKPKASSLKLNALRKKLRLQSMGGASRRPGASRARPNRTIDIRMADDDISLFDSMATLAPLSTTLPPLNTAPSSSRHPPHPPLSSSSASATASASAAHPTTHPSSDEPTPLTSLFDPSNPLVTADATDAPRLRRLAPAPLAVKDDDSSESLVALLDNSALPHSRMALDSIQDRLAAQDELLRQLTDAVASLTTETSKSRSSLRKRFAAVDSRIERSEKLTQKLSRDLQMQIDHSESVVYSYSNKLRRVEQAMIGRVTKNSTISDAALSWLVSVIFIVLWFFRVVYRFLTCSSCRSSSSRRSRDFDHDDIDLTPFAASPDAHTDDPDDL